MGARSLSVIPLCLLAAACGANVDSGPTRSTKLEVVDGVSNPDAFGFPIDRFQRNAAVGQVVMGSQGCSATLVGDRLVATAAHCVVMNMAAWEAGAEPQAGSPHIYHYMVGDDVEQPLCDTKGESVHIHPDAALLPSGAVGHDFALVVLDASVIETCPHVVPVQLNREPLTPDLLGQGLL